MSIYLRDTTLEFHPFRALVPPDTDVSLTISQDGYQSWDYEEHYGGPLRMRSGEELDLGQIDLTPKPKLKPGEKR